MYQGLANYQRLKVREKELKATAGKLASGSIGHDYSSLGPPCNFPHRTGWWVRGLRKTSKTKHEVTESRAPVRKYYSATIKIIKESCIEKLQANVVKF